VLPTDGSLLIEGDLDDKGLFVFHYEKMENLRSKSGPPSAPSTNTRPTSPFRQTDSKVRRRL